MLTDYIKAALRQLPLPEVARCHSVPPADVVRRFARGWLNFRDIYQSVADAWAVYDNSGEAPRLMESKS